MPKVTVYRVEDDEGIGPYQNQEHVFYGFIDGDEVWKSWWQEAPHQFQDRTPIPQEDGIIRIKENMKFGFTSLKQLNKWFTKTELFCLLSSGFKVKKYFINEKKIIHGKHQVAFFYKPEKQ